MKQLWSKLEVSKYNVAITCSHCENYNVQKTVTNTSALCRPQKIRWNCHAFELSKGVGVEDQITHGHKGIRSEAPKAIWIVQAIEENTYAPLESKMHFAS